MRNWKRDPYEAGHLSRGGRMDHVRLGADHPCSRLTEAQVIEIRKSEETTTALSKMFGVSWSTVDRARKGQTWRSINVE